MAEDELLLVSKAQAAKMLSISEDAFERFVMPETRLVRIGRRLLVDPASLAAWVEAHAALPLASELPAHACETAAARRRYTASLRSPGRAMVCQTNKRGGAGLRPAPRP
jgi:hypothetical protein